MFITIANINNIGCIEKGEAEHLNEYKNQGAEGRQSVMKIIKEGLGGLSYFSFKCKN